MLLVDAHLDLGRDALWWERDLTQEAITIHVQLHCLERVLDTPAA